MTAAKRGMRRGQIANPTCLDSGVNMTRLEKFSRWVQHSYLKLSEAISSLRIDGRLHSILCNQ